MDGQELREQLASRVEQAKDQATMLIRLLEAEGCIFHDEWYPESGVAKLKYTRSSDNHNQMWEIEVRARRPRGENEPA